MWLLLAAAMAVSTGTGALVGRFIGAGNRPDAEQATRQSMILAFLISAVVSVGLLIARVPILKLQGVGPDALPLASEYLFILALGQPIQFLNMILGALSVALAIRHDLSMSPWAP